MAFGQLLGLLCTNLDFLCIIASVYIADIFDYYSDKSLMIVNIGILLFPRELLKSMIELNKIMCSLVE